MLQPPSLDPKITEGKAKLVKRLVEETNSAWDSTGVCRFHGWAVSMDTMLEMINAATGFRYKDSDDLSTIGERINNLTRAFNVREGFSRKDDSLPYRELNEPLREGPCKGEVVRLEEMLNDYYELCNWDADGKPRKEKLAELGLDFVVKELYVH
jgi:aldehyde:ferredoxin oxidoreductase